MKNHKLYSIFIGLFLIALTIAGCNAGSSAKSDFPTGKFMSASNQYVGYVFNQDNTWTYLDWGEIGAQGTYSVKGNQWIEEGTEECPYPGTYNWSFDGTNLAFKLVDEDKCEPRRQATDGQIFVITK